MTTASQSLTLDLQPDALEALDAWIAAQPEPRPSMHQAAQHAIRDWLTGLGLLPFHNEPEALN